MRGIGGLRQIAARQLVLALGAGLDARELVGDRVVDGLIVAQLEMQERMVLDGAPVAAIDRVGADEIDGAGDPAPGALGHHQQDAVAHLFADDREEFAGEIRPAPFARAGVHVEGEKGVPDRFGEVGAGEPGHLDAGLKRLLALAADGLALARGEAAKEVVEAGVAGILPMELLVGALQEAALAERAPFRLGQEGDVGRRQLAGVVISTSASASAPRTASASGPGRASRRGPVTGVNGTATCSLG